MEYPVPIEGERSVDGHELMLFPPPPIVIKAEPLLPRRAHVLDVGSHSGRTGFYLSKIGHAVESIEIEEVYIEEGLKIAQALGEYAMRNTFTRGDMSKMDLGQGYDAVIATGSLQELARSDLHTTLGNIQNAAVHNGLNIVNAYIAIEEEQELVPHRAFFKPNELLRIYKDSGWKVIDQTEEYAPMYRAEDGGIRYFSYSELIARKPAPKPRNYMTANREIVSIHV